MNTMTNKTIKYPLLPLLPLAFEQFKERSRGSSLKKPQIIKKPRLLAHCFLLAERFAACIYIATCIDLLHKYNY